jgi:acetate kinase
MHEQGLDAQQLQSLLYQESGLLGVSGLSSDMRVLEASHAPEAEQALALYAARIGQSLGAMAATLGGLDALVFTAGIGENSAAMRARVAAGAAWLGAALDEGLNADGPPARRISRDDSRCALWVVPTDEALEMARQALVLAYQQG